jgi:hypothetical protein
MDLAAEVAALDERVLGPVVAQLLGRPVSLGAWTATPLTYQATNALSEGIFRIGGTSRNAAGSRDWSVVLKVLRPAYDILLARFPPEARPHLQEAYLWDREIRAYESGLLDDLPAGFAAPRCLGVLREPARCWLWLEDLGPTGSAWDVSRYALAARHLGRFNGAAHRAAILDVPWLSRDWLRTWLVSGFGSRADRWLEDDAIWAHKLVRSAFAAGTRARLRVLWAERVSVLERLAALPATLCHLDAFRANLFDRTSPGGDPETVAIDWSYIGLAPIGAEVAHLVMGSVSFADYGQDIRALSSAALDAYLAGLRDSGWAGAERDVRTGFALCAVRWVFMLNVLSAIADPARQAAFEKWAGQPFADSVAQAGARTAFLLDLLESALAARRD